jgi:hypothetical protein
VNVGAVVVFGLGLWLGVFSGKAPIGLTLIPALVAATAILLFLTLPRLVATWHPVARAVGCAGCCARASTQPRPSPRRLSRCCAHAICSSTSARSATGRSTTRSCG